MSMQLTKAQAIKWLLRNLKEEIQSGGCHYYKTNSENCPVCNRNLIMLERVKKVLGV